MSKRQSIPPELRAQILERVKTSGKPIIQIAEEHGINVKNIYNWLHRSVATTDTKETLRLQKENEELKRLVGELTVQMSRESKRGLLSVIRNT
jgi:transposase-like protein